MGVPRVDDQQDVSGIFHVVRGRLRWRDAPAECLYALAISAVRAKAPLIASRPRGVLQSRPEQGKPADTGRKE